jgi:hypothetical protein
VNGWKVASVAEQCRALLDVGDLRFPRLPGAVADLLAAGADPDRHIYPAMRNVARRGVEGVGSDALPGRRGPRADAGGRMSCAPPPRLASPRTRLIGRW